MNEREASCQKSVVEPQRGNGVRKAEEEVQKNDNGIDSLNDDGQQITDDCRWTNGWE